MAILNRNIVDDYSVVMISGSIVSRYKIYDVPTIADVVSGTLAGDGILTSREVVNSKTDIINITNVELSNNAIEVVSYSGDDSFDTMFISVLGDDI